MTSFLSFQNSIDQAVSLNKFFIIYRATAAKNYDVCRNIAQVVKLKVHVLQLLNVQMLQHDVTPTRHKIIVVRQIFCRATKVLT